MANDPRDIVEAGYDIIAGEYPDWMGRTEGDQRMRFLEVLMARLPASASVLDLGCGAGVPCTAALAERYNVLGVDSSTAQIELAAAWFPEPSSVRRI